MIFDLNIELQPKQMQLADALEPEFPAVIGYGGSKGGSKSHAGRTLINMRRWLYPGSVGLLFRRTFSELNENHIMRLLRDYPYMRDWYLKNDKMILYPNGSILRFGFAEYDSDIEQFNGKEYDDIFIDQAEQCSRYMLAILKGANRTTIPGYNPKFILTFNPGGQSHDFLKSKFVDRNLTDGEIKEGWQFIQSHGWDNAEWSKKSLAEDGVTREQYYSWTEDHRKQYFLDHSQYALNLRNLPDEDMVEAYLWGRWDVFSGQFFTKFRRDVHVIRDDVYIDPRYERRGAIDYGSVTVFHYGCRLPDGRIIIENESYTEDLSPKERAAAIASILIRDKIYKLLIYADTDMFGDYRNYTGSDKSPAQMMNDTFTEMMGPMAPLLIPVSKKSEEQKKYRVLCNEAVKEYLNWKKGPDGEFTTKPHLFIKERCTKLTITLPGLVFDPRNRDDIDPDVGSDHPYDSMKYLVMSLYMQKDLKEEVNVEIDPTKWLVQNVLLPQRKRMQLVQRRARSFMQI
jgi:phage terminase large subunit